MKRNISLIFTNHLKELERLHESLRQFGKSVAMPDRVVFEMNLVLDELFTNIVNCAFRDAEEHRIAIDISFKNNTVTVCIIDDGVPFNPDTVKSPDLACPIERRRIGGLGLHLVKKLVDEMNYLREEDHNIIILKKKIRSAVSGDSGEPSSGLKEQI